MAESRPPITDKKSFIARIDADHKGLVAAQETRDAAEHDLHVASERLNEAEQNLSDSLKSTELVGKLVRFITGSTVEVDDPGVGMDEWPTPLVTKLDGVLGTIVGYSQRDGKPNPILQFMTEGPNDEFFAKLPVSRKSVFGFDPTEQACDFELYDMPHNS